MSGQPIAAPTTKQHSSLTNIPDISQCVLIPEEHGIHHPHHIKIRNMHHLKSLVGPPVKTSNADINHLQECQAGKYRILHFQQYIISWVGRWCKHRFKWKVNTETLRNCNSNLEPCLANNKRSNHLAKLNCVHIILIFGNFYALNPTLNVIVVVMLWKAFERSMKKCRETRKVRELSMLKDEIELEILRTQQQNVPHRFKFSGEGNP